MTAAAPGPGGELMDVVMTIDTGRLCMRKQEICMAAFAIHRRMLSRKRKASGVVIEGRLPALYLPSLCGVTNGTADPETGSMWRFRFLER